MVGAAQGAFAHPTESIFKQHHSQTRLRDLAAKVESARKEVTAVTPETPETPGVIKRKSPPT
jgi:hypothetical protein